MIQNWSWIRDQQLQIVRSTYLEAEQHPRRWQAKWRKATAARMSLWPCQSDKLGKRDTFRFASVYKWRSDTEKVSRHFAAKHEDQKHKQDWKHRSNIQDAEIEI